MNKFSHSLQHLLTCWFLFSLIDAVFLVLLSSGPVNASVHNSLLDSLQNLLGTSLHDSEKVNIIIAISQEQEDENGSKALESAEQALAIAIKLNDSKLSARAYYNVGQKNFSLGNLTNALSNSQNAIKLLLQTADSSAAVEMSLLVSTCYMKLGKYKESIETSLAFLPYAEKMVEPEMIANIYTNLGNVYNYMNNNREAYSFYFKALEIMERSGFISPKFVNILNNTSTVFYSEFQGNQDKAGIDSSINYAQKALETAKKIKYDLGIYMALGNIGMAYESIKEYKIALKYYLEAIDVISRSENKEGIAFAYNNLGYVYEKLENFDKAIENFTTGLKMAKDLSFPSVLKDSYFGLAETYVAMGDYKKGHELYLLYVQIKDSLFNIESSGQVAEMQTKYETEKKEKQLQIQSLELSKKEAEVKKQRLMIWIVAVGMALVIVFAFFMYSRLQIIRRQKHIIERQKSVVDEKNKHLEEAKVIIEEKNKDILDSIRYAKRIQDAILPTEAYLKTHLPEHFVLYKPKDIVSGDFYWAYSSEGRITWAAVDCTGHGVPGAFMSMIGNSLLNEIIVENGVSDCSTVLNKLREGVIKALGQTGESGTQKDGMDMILCSMDKARSSLFFSGANNPLWIIRPGGNGSFFIEIPADKQPIGFFTDELRPFKEHQIPLQKGDTIYAFTDGFPDQFGGPKGKKFKYSQLKNQLLSIQDKSMAEQKIILNETIENWRTHSDAKGCRRELAQVDDMCIIGVRV